MAIGAIYNNGNGSTSGHVRVYTYNDDTLEWVKIGEDIDGENEGDLSGSSVSFSGDLTVAIGSPDNSDNGLLNGQVRIYKYVVE